VLMLNISTNWPTPILCPGKPDVELIETWVIPRARLEDIHRCHGRVAGKRLAEQRRVPATANSFKTARHLDY